MGYNANVRGNCHIPIFSFFTTILLLVVVQFGYSQTQIGSRICGNIIDAETREPIANANIFISNSSMGTASDENGYFEIRNIPNGRHEIIASVLGYEILKANIGIYNSSRRNFRFEMYKQSIEMEEIVVIGKPSRKRRRQLNHFRRNLLGLSANGNKSYIKNDEVIRFEESGNMLLAYAYEPLEIINDGLGYRIHYVLHEYIQTPEEIKYTGYPRFFEQTAKTYHDSIDWLENRKKTYSGSLRHFLTIICKNYESTKGDTTARPYKVILADVHKIGNKIYYADSTLVDTEGFYVIQCIAPNMFQYSKSRRLVNTNWFLSESENENEMYLCFEDFLQVEYNKEYYPFKWLTRHESKVSWISMTCDSTILDKQGRYFDKYTIKTTGLWARERVADMLPFDYIIGELEIESE